MGEEMEGKKVGEVVLMGRCPDALELAEKVRAASDHLLAAVEILEEIGEVELGVEVIGYQGRPQSWEAEEE